MGRYKIMNLNLISLITFVLYITAICGYCRRLRHLKTFSKKELIIITTLALSFHGYALYRWIDIDTSLGQNLNTTNVLSLISWLSACLILIVSLKKPTENLMVFVLPLTAFSLPLVYLFQRPEYFKTKENMSHLFHILTAIVSFGILIMAGFQALMLHIQNQALKNNPKSALVRFLPPIETMEILLFQIILLGFILLSFSLISAIGFVNDSYTLSHLHKILLSFLAWTFFAILLYKHHRSGWRGKTAIRWTLGGVLALLLAYFSSKLLFLSIG